MRRCRIPKWARQTSDNGGSHASLRSVNSRSAWPIPDGMSLEAGACIPIPFGTADDCLFAFGHLRRGETVLIHAGASGTGLAAIQLARRAGATILATGSSNDRLKRLEDYGLDQGINYTRWILSRQQRNSLTARAPI